MARTLVHHAKPSEGSGQHLDIGGIYAVAFARSAEVPHHTSSKHVGTSAIAIHPAKRAQSRSKSQKLCEIFYPANEKNNSILAHLKPIISLLMCEWANDGLSQMEIKVIVPCFYLV